MTTIVFFESKETFEHQQDGLSFNYKYVIECVRWDDKTAYGLYLLPCVDSLHKDKREAIAEYCCVFDDEFTTFDVFCYGCGIPMGCKCC